MTARKPKVVKTTFKGINPFTGERVMKLAPQKHVVVDELQICRDPLPRGRAPNLNKYDKLFEKMTFGDCLKVPTKNVSRVGAALRNWVKKNNRRGIVRSCMRYMDEKETGRVWLLEK